jgi:hypothetical protein
MNLQHSEVWTKDLIYGRLPLTYTQDYQNLSVWQIDDDDDDDDDDLV